MSQNQSYFWQTTRHNVYLKRSAKLQMLLALLAVLTYATICSAETAPNFGDDNIDSNILPKRFADGEKQLIKNDIYDAALEIPNEDTTKDASGKTGFVDAFTASISVILFTELGDKTFFIAAIMAMRHPRLIVFTGAITALALMTVLSVVFGMAATIIPKVYTYYISTALFAIFGLKMIYEGYGMKDSDAQEELEEVQSDLRKREDELLRSRHGKFEDADGKRKNSNSDQEENSDIMNDGVATIAKSTVKNPEMQHRQRKQLNSKLNKSNNLSNNNNNKNNNNNNGCELNNDNDIDEFKETDSFLNGRTLNSITNFHSSPALSSSALSNQTEQTNCDEFSPNKLNNYMKNPINDEDELIAKKQHHRIFNKTSNGSLDNAALVHSTSASAVMMAKNGISVKGKGNNNSINNLSNLSLNSAVVTAGQSNEELKKQNGGGSMKRLERDVTATLVQDPESGIVRKNSKKSATYLTTRVLMQAFTMTFLAEWGDRSQLTTIILAASKNVYGVISGGVIGHSICTGLAVIGGRIVAAKISVRTVTIVGGVVFLGFAFYALIARPDDI